MVFKLRFIGSGPSLVAGLLLAFLVLLAVGCDDDERESQSGTDEQVAEVDDEPESSEAVDESEGATELSSISLTDQELDQVHRVFEDGPDVERLRFSVFNGAQIAYALRLDEFEGVHTLNLSLASISVDEAKLIAQSPRLAQIESLRFSVIDTGQKALHLFFESEHLENLEYLHLSSPTSENELLTSLVDIDLPSGVNELALVEMGIDDDLLIGLLESGLFDDLKKLNLQGNEIGDIGVMALAESDTLSLESLALRGNLIGPQGIEALEQMGDVVQGLDSIRARSTTVLFSKFIEAGEERKSEISDLGERATEATQAEPWELPELTPPGPEGASTCPDDLEFRVARVEEGVPLFYERDLDRRILGDSYFRSIIIPTDDEAREFGLETDPGPVWVFSEEDGRPCPMLPRATAIYPDRSYGTFHMIVSALEGECDFESDRAMWNIDRREYVLAARADEMPSDCRIELADLTDEQGDQNDLARLKADVGADPPMSCDEDDEGCDYSWQILRRKFEDGTALIMGDEVITHPHPEDVEYPCGDNITDIWSSGLYFEKEGDAYELDGSPWPKVFRLVNGDGEPSMMILSDDQGRILPYSFNDEGIPEKLPDWVWFVYLEDNLGAEPSYAGGLGLYCDP
jgi:hypothetical protein